MSKRNAPCGVLVYDRYYGEKPKAPLLVLKKLLWCCAFAVCGMMFLLTEYELPARLWVMGAVCAAAAAGFSLIFSFVRRGIAIPVMAAGAAWAAFTASDEVRARLSYFADALMLSAKGRFFDPEGLLFNPQELLTELNADYVGGVELGCGLMCVVFALVCAAAFARKPAFVPPVCCLIVMAVPLLAAERLEFNAWLLPFAALAAAAAAVRVCFRGGLAPARGGSPDYRRAAAFEEHEFRRGMGRADYAKRVSMSAVYYSKYFSVGMYCAALFACAGIAASAAFGRGSSIDYSAVYEFVTGLGGEQGITSSPFDGGRASEYFTTPQGDGREDSLNVVSPGTGDEEILRVSASGSAPVYLRGDIGIDFTGTSWTSPVNNEPREWRSGRLRLDRVYRPCEARVIHSMMQMGGYEADNIISVADVTIDYLCDTSVVFLPAYTSEYAYYDSELFDVYGDYVVRVNQSFDNVNTVQCTALVPAYTSTDSSGDGMQYLNPVLMCFAEWAVTPNSIFNVVVPEMSGGAVLTEYAEYVNKAYTKVPDAMAGGLENFLRETGLADKADELLADYPWTDGAANRAYTRYACAQLISDYLRDNYAYSLTTDNGAADPVMSFLNETKSGHCSLYASALTLLLRECGVPARYCTGFVADPALGSVVTLRAKNLHAWTEVYLDQYGWVTFDPTSSAANPAPAQPAIQTTAPAATTRPAPVTSAATSGVPAHTTAPAPSAPAESRVNITLILAIAGGAAALIIAAACAVYALYGLKKRAERSLANFAAGEAGESARDIYEVITDILAFLKMSPANGELPEAFFARCDSRFGTGLAKHAAALQQAAFGSGDMDEEQRGVLHGLLCELYAKAQKAAGVRRVWLWKIMSKK